LAEADGLSPELRTQLTDWWYVIGQMATPVYRTEAIEGTFAEELQVHWVRVDDPTVERVMAALRGDGEEEAAGESEAETGAMDE